MEPNFEISLMMLVKIYPNIKYKKLVYVRRPTVLLTAGHTKLYFIQNGSRIAQIYLYEQLRDFGPLYAHGEELFYLDANACPYQANTAKKLLEEVAIERMHRMG